MKKYVCLFFCFVLITTAPVRCYASSASGTLTVASGSGSAVGGLFSDYGVNSKTSAIALTLVLLNSLGATVKLTDQAIQAGKKVQDVIMDKFAQWVGGSSAESMTEEQKEELKKRFKVINGGGGTSGSDDQGTNIGPDGKVYFGLGALGILTEFIKFLNSNNDIQDYQDPASNLPYINIGGYNTAYGGQVIERNINNSSDGVIYRPDKSCAVCNINDHVAVFICNEFFWNRFYQLSDGALLGSYGSGSYHGFYYSTDSLNGGAVYDFPAGTHKWPGDTTVQQLIDSIVQFTPQDPAPSEISEDGIYKGENYDDSIIENPTQPIVVDPGILPNVIPESDQQVSIPDYLQMILDNTNANVAQSQDPIEVPVTDPVTLSPGTLTVPVQEQDPIQQPLPAETVAPENVPVNPVQDTSKLPEPADTIKLLKVDLTGIFPFCIPWDIYNLLSKFVTDPVTPSLDWDWGSILGFLGINTVTHLDLHDYDGVAEILRNMETFAFVVGLAYATKKVFVK